MVLIKETYRKRKAYNFILDKLHSLNYKNMNLKMPNSLSLMPAKFLLALAREDLHTEESMSKGEKI